MYLAVIYVAHAGEEYIKMPLQKNSESQSILLRSATVHCNHI